jgi:hypothetical protein
MAHLDHRAQPMLLLCLTEGILPDELVEIYGRLGVGDDATRFQPNYCHPQRAQTAL